MTSPDLSLIVPTRHRVPALRRFLDSLATTARCPDRWEVILVVDADDPSSAAVSHPALRVQPVIVAPGQTMGALNQAGFAASHGAWVMLLNDDVVARTPGWDLAVRECTSRYPDGALLVHVNDALMRRHLCTFPIVSRFFCELAGGVCPVDYERYCIDDHIEDIFNLLAVVGHRRTIYLPEVVFEHLNAVVMAEGHREYHAEARALARDQPRFAAAFPMRKAIAEQLLQRIAPQQRPHWARLLERLPGPMAPRPTGRQQVGFPGRGLAGRAIGRARLALQERWPTWRTRARRLVKRLLGRI